MAAEPPLVVIVGPTASGKTALSIELARKYDGEIISADSRAVYKGMDIGTAKPTEKEQAIVPHWGLNLVEPGEYFSVADFKLYADQKINEIKSRGHIPFLVGGTGLYIDAVLFDYQFGPPADKKLRDYLQHKTISELQEYCVNGGIQLPENKLNKRYLIRTIEAGGAKAGKCTEPLENSIVVGISTDKEVLRRRISRRTEQLFENGVVNEAKNLGKKYGWDSEAMKSNIYPLICNYLEGEMTLNEVKSKFITVDYRLAKRQMTWLQRNKFIQWLDLNDAEKYLNERLAKHLNA